MAQQERYTNASREFLAKAQEALAQGDLVQASEKGWGAVAQMVKAVAARRRWRHGGHADLYQVVDRLVAESGDPQLDLLFGAANGLHTNFYENWMPRGSVERGLAGVREFIQKMERFLE
jgi:hypothetical protein